MTLDELIQILETLRAQAGGNVSVVTGGDATGTAGVDNPVTSAALIDDGDDTAVFVRIE